jgi:hypothetical protein
LRLPWGETLPPLTGPIRGGDRVGSFLQTPLAWNQRPGHADFFPVIFFVDFSAVVFTPSAYSRRFRVKPSK